jgi:ATP-binding cassette subfamily F protein 3
MKILTGSLDADDGFFEYGYGQKIGYYDQDSQILNENGTVIDELINCDAGLTITQIRTLLASFGFIGEDVFKNIDVLSGGERARLSICKLVLSGTSLLILDEPTNHLDIPSRETLENALKEYEGTVLSVSHDRYFASALATAILEIDTNSFSDGYTYFRGSYSDYQSKRRLYVDVESVSAEKKQASVDYKAAKEEKARRQKNAKRIVTLEKLIADSEARVAEIKSLSIGEYASDYVMLEQLANEQSELEEKITEYYEEYFNLTEEE